MRLFIYVFVLFFLAYGQKRFEAEYFIKKHNLKLPKVTEKMLDVSELTHTSDLWEYYYQGKTEKLDSVVRYLTIERFQSSKGIERYQYFVDSVIVTLTSVNIIKGDTSNNWITVFKDNFRDKNALDLQTNCLFRSKFDERGIKLLDVSKCPGDTGFTGQVFRNTIHGEYIESIETYRGKTDSNSIRRYYLAPFDSILADYMVRKGEEPFIVCLNIYNKYNKKQISYDFDIFSTIHDVFNFNHYAYTNKNQLYRIYSFYVKNSSAKEKEYELVNYTEYEYDDLGRKVKATTRVKPDPKESKAEEKK